MMKSSLITGLVLAVVAISPASASTITYSLDTSFCSSTCQTPAGTITITDLSGGGVLVDEELAPNVFANTGAGVSLAFDLSTTSGLMVTNLTTGFTVLGAGNYAKTGTGAFNWAVDCTSCGSGTSAPQFSSVMFDLSGVTTASFLTNSAGLNALSDIGVKQSNGTFNTGNIGANGGSAQPPPAPEPATMVLMGSALVGIGVLRRRNRKA